MKAKIVAKTFDFFPRPQYAFLQGQDAQAFLEEFNARADEKYKEAAGNVKVLRYDAQNQLITGSNPFAVVHVNSIMRKSGILTATQADLEAFRGSLLDRYEDSALVLRSLDDLGYSANNYVAKHLAEQMPQRFKKSVGNVPVVFHLTELDLINDSKSQYGLKFLLRDAEKIYEAPILAQEIERFRSEDVDKETGLPTKLGNGDRALYTRKSGLSRLLLRGFQRGSLLGLAIASGDGSLAGSNNFGRVVVSRC